MGYHLNPLPGSADKDALGFYVVHKSEFGHLTIISDIDPQDDVRKWEWEASAESVAVQQHMVGWPVSGVVQIVEGGSSFKLIDQVLSERFEREKHYASEQARKQHEDRIAMGAYANYTDYGTW